MRFPEKAYHDLVQQLFTIMKVAEMKGIGGLLCQAPFARGQPDDPVGNFQCMRPAATDHGYCTPPGRAGNGAYCVVLGIHGNGFQTYREQR
jgi:hypothetical protein